jgi:hypothetical protein
VAVLDAEFISVSDDRLARRGQAEFAMRRRSIEAVSLVKDQRWSV